MDDRARLALLYATMPETTEQSERRVKLIRELELKLGLRDIDNSAMVVNGDLDDMEGIKAKKR